MIHFIITIQYTVHKEAFGSQRIPVSQQPGEALTWQEVVPTSVNPAAGRQRKEGYEIEAILNYTLLHPKALFQVKKRMNEPVFRLHPHNLCMLLVILINHPVLVMKVDQLKDG